MVPESETCFVLLSRFSLVYANGKLFFLNFEFKHFIKFLANYDQGTIKALLFSATKICTHRLQDKNFTQDYVSDICNTICYTEKSSKQK